MKEGKDVAPNVFIREIGFSCGTKVELEPDEVVVLVGPNNAGKSRALMDIRNLINRASPTDDTNTICVTEVSLGKTSDATNFKVDWEQKYSLAPGSHNGLAAGPYRIVSDWAVNYLSNETIEYLGNLAPFICKLVDADSRLDATKNQEHVHPNAQGAKPSHFLYDSNELLAQTSALFKSVFGEDLVLDYKGGALIPIHVGKQPELEANQQVIDPAYVEKVRSLPLLQEQGHGMRCFAGLLLETLVIRHDITLIDEPEAFLHPPQARRLGTMFAQEAPNQMLLATHSIDLLKGLLDQEISNVRIIRITRASNRNYPHEIKPSEVLELRKTPELRYSNILDGIFHELAVLCEADADCKLYNIVAEYLREIGEIPIDVAFFPCNGKSGITKAAGAIRKLGVETVGILDIDLLADKEHLKRTVHSFGGKWTNIETDWKMLDKVVREGVLARTADEIRSDIGSLLKETTGKALPKGKISDLLRQDKPWQIVKKGGLAAIPKGEGHESYNKIECYLRGIGIHLVSVGEIENFFQSVGGHGPKFVQSVLEQFSPHEEEFDQIRKFVRDVLTAALQCNNMKVS